MPKVEAPLDKVSSLAEFLAQFEFCKQNDAFIISGWWQGAVENPREENGLCVYDLTTYYGVRKKVIVQWAKVHIKLHIHKNGYKFKDPIKWNKAAKDESPEDRSQESSGRSPAPSRPGSSLVIDRAPRASSPRQPASERIRWMSECPTHDANGRKLEEWEKCAHAAEFRNKVHKFIEADGLRAKFFNKETQSYDGVLRFCRNPSCRAKFRTVKDEEYCVVCRIDQQPKSEETVAEEHEELLKGMAEFLGIGLPAVRKAYQEGRLRDLKPEAPK